MHGYVGIIAWLHAEVGMAVRKNAIGEFGISMLLKLASPLCTLCISVSCMALVSSLSGETCQGFIWHHICQHEVWQWSKSGIGTYSSIRDR